MDRKKWKTTSESEDENLRIPILKLLLKSLCLEHAEYAFTLFDTILKDQNNCFKPLGINK